MPERLTADALHQPPDFGDLAFASTDELQDFEGLLGQPRATQAIEVALGVRQPGFNLYAMGRGGLGRHGALYDTLLKKAAEAPPARDWCYVQDFNDLQRPRALSLSAGMAIRLRADVVATVRGRFTIHASDAVDEVMTLLTGFPAGEADAATDRFPPDTVNGRIQVGLEQFVDVQKRLAREMHGAPAPKEQDDG
ncbi:MAG: AAA family ATPase [Gammaproteobacteria bacterium]|nr:AAA family ATPase [Gammaproteobacteria bacterium]